MGAVYLAIFWGAVSAISGYVAQEQIRETTSFEQLRYGDDP